MIEFERKPRNEELDTATIVALLLKVQAAYAVQQNRPPGRGTHTKGTCARATFEVFDVAAKFTDPALASRLAHGLFARPGVYPATVRFANARSFVAPDREADIRAISFAVELPEGAPVPRQDFSMQTAGTFPIDNVHDFATFLRVSSAASTAEKMRALSRFSPAELLQFIRTAAIGGAQMYLKTGAYQKNRYWSTVPFRNGPSEAAKFDLTPSPSNPAQPLANDPDALQNEIARHLNEDRQMSTWEFGVQLLEPAVMTHRGRRHDASYWVEHASVDWKESQAPFYPVGRLTLEPKSVMSAEECQAQHIDVNVNRFPEHEPIGGINRARHAAERASYEVRRGLATAEEIRDRLPFVPDPKPSRVTTASRLALGLVVLCLVGYYGFALLYNWRTARNLPPNQPIDRYVYLNQGWGGGASSANRDISYYTPQGTSMHDFRYSWFVHLERPFSHRRFADPEHMRRLNFIVDPAPDGANPDQLPVGFARRWDSRLDAHVVDITCAACHTGQLKIPEPAYQSTTTSQPASNGHYIAVRIDGGPAMTAFTDHSFGSFQADLALATGETLLNPFKFHRFAVAVLGPHNSLSAEWRLWRNLASVAGNLGDTFMGSSAPWHYPTQEGYGRTDALARISNVVFGDHVSSLNYHVGNGPVSYPYLWNIWKFDWEQYNASVSQPMARNVGEALGVGADFRMTDDYGRPLPESSRYETSVSFTNLYRIESNLQQLKPPQWPAQIFGPVDQQKAAQGKVLFNTYCVKCHGPQIVDGAEKAIISPLRGPGDPLWSIEAVDVHYVGTDPHAADNFAGNTVDLSPAGITASEIAPLLRGQLEQKKARQEQELDRLNKLLATHPADAAQLQDQVNQIQRGLVTDASIDATVRAANPNSMNMGAALNVLGLIIRQHYYADNRVSPAAQACLNGFGTLDMPQVIDGYKPRPLEGVWATAPFLHNGSVPTIYQLLSPLQDRAKGFYVDSQQFDPVHVGLVVNTRKGSSSGFWFDTTKPGNLNAGHLFGDGYSHGIPGYIGPALTEEQRYDIIEYLKVKTDDPEPVPGQPPAPASAPVDCLSLLNPSAAQSAPNSQLARNPSPVTGTTSSHNAPIPHAVALSQRGSERLSTRGW